MTTRTKRIFIGVAIATAFVVARFLPCTPDIHVDDQSQPNGLFSGGPGFVPGNARGDLTGITAGSGLTGGGTTGAVTVNVGAGSGLSVSADLVAVNIAGATCSNGQALTALSATGAGTCGAPVTNQYSGTHLEWIEEYLPSPLTSGLFGSYQITVASGSFTSNQGTTTRPGIWEASTLSSTTGRATVQTSQGLVDFGSGTWNFQWTGGFPSLSTVADEYNAIVGFWDSVTINATDACYFLYDRGNTATSGPNAGNADAWSCWCASNSVRTTYLINGTGNSDESFPLGTAAVAAAALPNTNIVSLEVRMTGTTRAEFFFNGTKVCNIATNIPSGASRLTGAGWQILKSAGATARTMLTDRTRIAVDLNSARSP